MIVSAATITVNKISGCKQNDLPAYFIEALYHHGVQYEWKKRKRALPSSYNCEEYILEKISLIIFNKVKMDKNAWFAKTGIKDLRLTKIPHNTRVTSLFISRINLVSVPCCQVTRLHRKLPQNWPFLRVIPIWNEQRMFTTNLQVYQCYNLIVALISWIIQIHIRIN